MPNKEFKVKHGLIVDDGNLIINSLTASSILETNASKALTTSSKLTAYNKNFGGNGSASTISRSDHTHSGYLSTSGGTLSGDLHFGNDDFIYMGATNNLNINYNVTNGALIESDSVVTIGTSSADVFNIQTNNTTKWIVNSSGHFYPNTDNSYNLGSAGTRMAGVWAVNFTGDLTGNADTATWADKVDVNSSTSTSTYGILWHSSDTVYGQANVTIQPSTGNFTTAGTIYASNFSGSSSGTNTGDVTLATNHGLSLSNQVIGMGTPSTLTASTTNAVTTTTHTHAITGFLPSSGGSLSGSIHLGDSNAFYFGTGDDFNISFSGTNTYMTATLGEILIKTVESKPIYLGTNSTWRWYVNGSGHLLPYIDSGYNIGSPSLKVKDYYGDNANYSGNITIANSGVNGMLLDTDSGTSANSNRLFFKNATTQYAIANIYDSLQFNYSATWGSSSGTTAMYINSGGSIVFNNTSYHYNGAKFNDNDQALFGDASDLKIYHDGSNSFVANTGSPLYVGTTDAHVVNFRTNNTGRWQIDTTGNFLPISDSAYNIGSSTNQANSIYATNYLLDDTDGKGLAFWRNDNYKIYMSASGNGTWGGRLDSTSDYNMYFKMTAGTNRGFVFMNGTTPKAQIDSSGNAYVKSVIITDSSGNPKYQLVYNETEDSLDTVKL